MEDAGKGHITDTIRLQLYRGKEEFVLTLSGTILIKQSGTAGTTPAEYAPVEWVTIMPTRKRMPKAGLF